MTPHPIFWLPHPFSFLGFMDLLSGDHPISQAAIVAILLVITFFGFYLLLLRYSLSKAVKRYPPVAGTIFHQLLNISRLHHYQTDLSRRFKTFRILTPFCNYVYTVDPVNVEYILKSNFSNYGKGSYHYENLKDLFGNGIFAVDHEKWRQQRKVASYEFSTKILRDYSSSIFRRNATRLAHIISEAASSNQSFDIQNLLMKSTLDSIFKVGFGVELNSLCGSREGTVFAKAFDESSALILRRYIDVFWKIKRFFNVGSEAELKKSVKLMDDFVYRLIECKTEQMSKQTDDSLKKDDILSRFLIERERDPKKMNNQYLRDIILNFIIAGRDTSAGTLSWFLYMLCKHPAVQEKVVQEVKASTQTDGNTPISEFTMYLTEEALNKMNYLHAALTETLRLYPALPLDSKYCFSDDTLPDGHFVRKGDMVDYQPYAMGRMKFLWGDDVEIYKPERWLNDKGIFQPDSPYKFTAFQSGPRICLGKEFAYRQMKIFAATLLRFFQFELRDEEKAVNYRTMLTLQIDQGLHLYAFHR